MYDTKAIWSDSKSNSKTLFRENKTGSGGESLSAEGAEGNTADHRRILPVV